MSVSYRAFGELRVSVDGATTSIGRRRERQVLATLIATRGTAVPAARLATDLWGQDAGPTALGLVQVAVSRLRSLLEPDRPSRGGTHIVSTTAGYLLRAQPEAVDVWTYEDLARRVLDHPLSPEQVVDACTQAEALWSTPYAGVEAPESQAHADRLHELHTDLLAQHARALLDLDHPDAAVRLLSPVVGEHPYRETLWCLHALAQYRSGRQAGALETMRRLRAALADDLGVDPVAETTALEQPGWRVGVGRPSGRTPSTASARATRTTTSACRVQKARQSSGSSPRATRTTRSWSCSARRSPVVSPSPVRRPCGASRSPW